MRVFTLFGIALFALLFLRVSLSYLFQSLPHSITAKELNAYLASTRIIKPSSQPDLDNNNTVPLQIYTFWSSHSVPPLIHACILTWRIHHSSFEITVITPSTLSGLVNNTDPRFAIPQHILKMTKPTQADWIRLAVLSIHGGIWIDASVILSAPLTNLPSQLSTRPDRQSQIHLFSLSKWTNDIQRPIYESWYIAAPRNHPLILDWYDEFDHCFRNHKMRDTYLDNIKSEHGEYAFASIVQGITLVSYVKIHVSLQKVLRLGTRLTTVRRTAEEEVSKFKKDAIYAKISSMVADAEGGPLNLQRESGWSTPHFAKRFTRKWNGKSTVPKMIKLRSLERMVVEWLVEMKRVDQNSLIAQLLNTKILDA